MFQGPMAQQARQMLNDPNFRRMMTDPEMMRNMSNMRRSMPGLFGGLGGQNQGGNQAFPMPGSAEGGDANTTTQNENQRPSAGQQWPANPYAQNAGNPFAALFGGAAPPGNTGIPGENTQGTESTPAQQQQNQTNPPDPFQAASQMLMQNPQLMQQLMGSMGMAPNPNEASSNAQGQQNPFAALQALGNMGAMNPGGFGGFGTPSPQPQDDRPPEDRYAEQLRQLNDMGFYEFERNVEALRRTGGSVQGAVEYLLTR